MGQITACNALFPVTCQACYKFYNRLTGKGIMSHAVLTTSAITSSASLQDFCCLAELRINEQA